MPFHDYLYYSVKDRRSIVLIAVIAVVGVATTLIVNGRKSDANEGNNPISVCDSDSVSDASGDRRSPRDTEIRMAEFDPNTVDSSTLVSFGLTPRQARTFVRYREAGAVFRTPESIGRVYGLSDEDLARLLPYVRIGREYAATPVPLVRRDYPHHSSKPHIPDTTKAEWKRHFPEKFSKLTKVDPNTADTTLLQRIPGIGTWISRSIVDHRDKLGGYHSADQLLEVKYFPPELLEWFEVKNTDVEIRKININTASFNTLRSHPYIRYEQARDLQRYIRLYGNIADMTALGRTSIFTEKELTRLVPYIEF